MDCLPYPPDRRQWLSPHKILIEQNAIQEDVQSHQVKPSITAGEVMLMASGKVMLMSKVTEVIVDSTSCCTQNF
jgi:hypothetical protein